MSVAAALLLIPIASAGAAQTHLFQSSFNGSDAPVGAVGPLSSPFVITVDNSATASAGTVYVGDNGLNVVDRFSAAGAYLGQLKGDNTPQGEFSTPWGLAVDPASADLYVADLGHGAVDKFDSSGALVSGFGTGGQITAADIEAGQLGSSAGPEPFLAPHGVAVDPTTKDLYVADANNAVIDVFDSSGKYLRQFATAGTFGLAIDSAGNLFATNGSEAVVYVAATGAINPAYGSGSGQLDAAGSLAVAVDPATQDVYLTDSDHFAQYDSSGALVDTFGSGHVSNPVGIGVGGASGKIYVDDFHNFSSAAEVDIFGPLVTVPDTTTEAATAIEPTSVTFNGHLDPAGGGETTDCHFEYLRAADFAANSNGYAGPRAPTAVPCAQGNSLNAPTSVSATAAGLEPNTEYHFRLVVANSAGVNQGADEIVTTLAITPSLTGGPVAAENISRSGAKLTGFVDPENSETTYHFAYGLTESYGSSIPVPDANAGSSLGAHAVYQILNDLTPATTYHFALIATNAQGTVSSSDQTFTTGDATPPLATTGAASAVTQTTASVSGVVDPHGLQTVYRIELGTSTSYGTIFFGTAGSGSSSQTVGVTYGALAPSTTYHFRVSATNADGTSIGTDATFTTGSITQAAAPPPPTTPVTVIKGRHKKHHTKKHNVRRAAHNHRGGNR
jgi:DNA-binding beta-propeller fold protein YncE